MKKIKCFGIKFEKIKLISITLLCVALALFQVSCKKTGKCEAKCDSHGNCEASCSMTWEFDSPKATEQTKTGAFDQLLVFDLNKNYLISDRISINANYRTDRGFTKSGTFYLRKDLTRRISAAKPNALVYSFVPENKTLLDNFFKEALTNTTQKITSTITTKFTIKSKDPKVTQVVLSSADLGVRAKLTLAEPLGPLPVPLACCR